MSENEWNWITTESLQLSNEIKPSPNDASQQSFAAEGNDQALWEKLLILNEKQEKYSINTEEINEYQKEDDFISLILTIEGDKLSKELFSMLFELLINNSFSTESQIESKGDFLYIFFELLKKGKCDVSIIIALLQELFNLVISSTRLKYHCCSKQWVLRLLEILPTIEDERILGIFVNLIKQLATFSISTIEIQAIFRIMNTENELFKPSHLAVMLDILRSITQRFGPDVYFDFNGRNSGIQLASFPKGWPGGEGYGFCSWIRIESFNDPLNGKNYQPFLFSCTSKEGTGIEVYFINRVLHLRIIAAKSKVLTVRMDYTFEIGKWYFIFISHLYHFIRRSEVSMYLNGKLISSHALNYPKGDKILSQVVVGNNSSIFRKKPSERSQPFYGQMSNIYFFSSPIPKHEDVHSIYTLGPNFTPIIDPVESKILIGVGQYTNQFLLDGRRHLKIQCSFNPKAIYSSNKCLDTANLDLLLSGIKLKGTSTVRTHGIKESLYCTGGIRILIPLFKSLDQPIIQQINYNNTNTNNYVDNQNNVDPHFTIQVLNLLQNMLQNNQQNQQHMVLAHGFQIIGNLLESINPQCFTTNTIQALEQLALAVIGCEPLFRQLFLNIFLNLTIWIYTKVEIQNELFSLLIRHTKKKPGYFRNLITVQRLVDILRRYYWFTPDSFSEATQPIINNITLETLGKRPEPHTLKQIRVSILQLAKIMAHDGFTLEETKSFILYLQDCQDTDQGVDVLQMILATISINLKQGKIKNDMSEWIFALGGITPFIGLLQRKSLMLRIWSLKVIAKLLQISSTKSLKQKDKLTSSNSHNISNSNINTSNINTSNINSNNNYNNNNNNRLILLKHYLQSYEFNETTYFTLLEILLEIVNNREFKNPLQHSEHEYFIIKNPSIISVIFEMLCTAGQSSLQYKVLQDFHYLLNQSEENRSIFIQQPYWQNWLLGLLANNSSPSNSSSEVFKQIVKLLTLLFHHSLFDINGWKIFNDSQALLHFFGNQGFFNTIEISRDININMLRIISYDSKLLQQSQNISSVWENLTKWLYFTEECLFITPQSTDKSILPLDDDHFLLGIHRRYDGMWIDFEFAQKLLDFLDSILLVNQDENGLYKQIGSSEENLIRLTLRLTLYSLYETDSFLNTDKIQERSKNLKNVETAVDEYFSIQDNYPPIKNGLESYLQGKIKQWNTEMNSVDKVFQKNIDRLRQIVNRLLSMDKQLNRLMYIISFLYKAMKRSYEHQGIGAELILNIFKEILISCRYLLPISNELTTMNEDQYVEFFMRHFAFPNEQPTLFKQFDDGIKQILLEEQEFSCKIYDKLQHNISNICLSVKNYHSQEIEQIKLLHEENTKIFELQQKIEKDRIIEFQKYCSQTHRSLNKRTKSILHELEHKRGPWATPKTIKQQIYWKLSKIESSSRKRILLKRNYNFSLHEQSIKGQGGGYEINNNNQQKDDISLKLLDNLNNVNFKKDNNNSNNNNNNDNDMSSIILNTEKKTIFQCTCELITPMIVTKGNIEITPENIYFIVSKDISDSNTNNISNNKSLIYIKKQPSRKWSIKHIKYIYGRRYLLRNNGIEIFFSDRTNYFFNFDSSRTRDLVWKKLITIRPPNLVDFGSGGSITNLSGFGSPPSGSQLLKRMNITSRWKNREISNFDYIMWLNTLSGRTYNDLTQYPIFPWILKDYESLSLDLNNPNIYRDLSKPIGALNPQRLQQFIERYNAFDDPNIPKFYYGSHYSNIGVVLYYLLRLEPYTSYFLKMQGGQFDHPTRMFMSIRDTWENCLTNPSDVKELIPEFFYLPEFLENQNNFCFGYYNGLEVKCDVELPSWAKDKHDFIIKHREALESDYVSNHLHEWLDLIFGYKQRGPEAETSYNLFFYLTYEGVIDIDSIEDPIQRKSIEAQIINFGQTPSQLFDKPHPKRKTLDQIQKSKLSSSSLSIRQSISPFYDLQLKQSKPIIFNQYTNDKLIFLTMDGIIGYNTFIPKYDKNNPFSFELDKTINSKHQKRIDMIYPEPISCPSKCFGISKDAKVLFTCGMWNDDIQARHFSQYTKYTRAEHRDIVTCLKLTEDGKTLISGSKDCTLVIWQINTSSPSTSSLTLSSFWSSKNSKTPQIFTVKQILYGHTKPITCVDSSYDLNLVISGSKDKSIILFNLDSGSFIRSIELSSPISQVYLSCEGYFIVYCDDIKMLSLYSINGELIKQTKVILSRILDGKFSSDGKYFISVGVGNAIIIRSIPSFQIVYVYEVSCPVFSLDFINGQDISFISVGLLNGQIRIYPFEPSNFLFHPPNNI